LEGKIEEERSLDFEKIGNRILFRIAIAGEEIIWGKRIECTSPTKTSSDADFLLVTLL